MRDLRLSQRDLLVQALAHATGEMPTVGSAVWKAPLAQPDRLHAALRECVDGRTVVVTGTLDRRLVLIEHKPGGTWTAADLSGLGRCQPRDQRPGQVAVDGEGHRREQASAGPTPAQLARHHPLE